MRKIELSRGYTSDIDDEDYEWVSQYKWNVSLCNHTQYAYRYSYKPNGTGAKKYMHREIMERYNGALGSGMQIDNINHDGLNNRKTNLRICTQSQNNWNGRGILEGTSKYKGVYFYKSRGKWVAQMCLFGKRIFIGRFDSEIDAARAYDRVAKEKYGEFAKLNFPEE